MQTPVFLFSKANYVKIVTIRELSIYFGKVLSEISGYS